MEVSQFDGSYNIFYSNTDPVTLINRKSLDFATLKLAKIQKMGVRTYRKLPWEGFAYWAVEFRRNSTTL